MWKSDGLKRHYTISNCMEPKVYSEYIRIMKEYNENRWNSEIKINKKFFECDSDKEFIVTIKKYD